MVLEVDDRRPQHLDARVAAQRLARAHRQLHVLAEAPDPPLAAVDRLPDLEVAAVRGEARRQLLDRGAPARRVAHQLAVLRQREGQLVAARRELARQRLLGGVVVLPGVKAQQQVPDAQLLDRGEEPVGVVRPGAERDPDAAPRDRPRVELARQRPVAAADPRQRRGDDRPLLQVGAGVGEAHAELGEAAGVLVRLVGEVVPDDPVAHRGRGRRRRDVGVRPARDEQGFHAAAHAPQPVLRLVLPAKAEVMGEVDAARHGLRAPLPSTPAGAARGAPAGAAAGARGRGCVARRSIAAAAAHGSDPGARARAAAPRHAAARGRSRPTRRGARTRRRGSRRTVLPSSAKNPARSTSGKRSRSSPAFAARSRYRASSAPSIARQT